MTANFQHIINTIEDTINAAETVLSHLPEATISINRNSQDRTIKQIMGHLIDSASNNHQRIVRLQYNEYLIFPDYRQDNDL